MSPGLAILCCAMVELNMESGPEGLIGMWSDSWTVCLVFMQLEVVQRSSWLWGSYGALWQDSSGLSPTIGAQNGAAC